MWSAIRWLVLRIAAVRWLFKLGWLGALVPIALVLKAIGLPALFVMGILAIPALILLVLFGLPIIMVVVFGSLFMGFVGMVLALGLVALKLAIFVALPIWLVWKVLGWIFKRGNGGGSSPDVPAAPPPPPPPPTGASDATGTA